MRQRFGHNLLRYGPTARQVSSAVPAGCRWPAHSGDLRLPGRLGHLTEQDGELRSAVRAQPLDDAQAFTAAQLPPLASLVPADHIMFGSDWPAVHSLFVADNVEKMPFLEGRLPDPRAGDPEPPVDGVYSPHQRIALERTNALARFPKLRARIPRLSRH